MTRLRADPAAPSSADTPAGAAPVEPGAAEPGAAATDPLDFDPVHVRPRADGWTPERQHRFIGFLADTGSVARAAMLTGMTAESAYRLRRREDGASFDAAWDAAMAMATRRLVDAAFERAIEGDEQPVFHKGEIVGTRRKPSDRLLMFLLRHHQPLMYGSLAGPIGFDPTPADPRGPRVARFPALLARLLGGEEEKKPRASRRP